MGTAKHALHTSRRRIGRVRLLSEVTPHSQRASGAPAWSLPELAGRLSELSGLGHGTQLSLAFSLVHDAQRRGEPVGWVTDRSSTFFPPDAASRGVDLSALPVVFVPDAASAVRAASRLARSGSFGLLILDVVGCAQRFPPALQSRLIGLAQKHDIAVVYLTEKAPEAASISSLISLRCQSSRTGQYLEQKKPRARFTLEGGVLTSESRDDPSQDLTNTLTFSCRMNALKDKRRGPGWNHEEWCRGPAGLR